MTYDMDENFLKTINATYMLAEYFPEADPLTIKTKEKILNISESFIVEGLSKKIEKEVDVLMNYLAMARKLGWINAMNYLIICKGFEDTRAGLLNKDRLPGLRVKPAMTIEQIPAMTTGQGKDNPASPSFPRKRESSLTSRQQKIVEFLKQKEKAQVSDLQQVLPDVTKRTIRRDLDELLEMGQIVRTGNFNQVSYQMSE